MRDETIARNYAETLFALAERHGGVAPFHEGIDAVARLIEDQPRVREFLETPRVASAEKKRILETALGDSVPPMLTKFLKVVIDKRRQRLVRQIAASFDALVDEHVGRTHVDVTVARAMDDQSMAQVSERLSQALGKQVIPHVRVDPSILGGIVVQEGDTVYDGSVRRQLEGMRHKLLAAELVSAGGADA